MQPLAIASSPENLLDADYVPAQPLPIASSPTQPLDVDSSVAHPLDINYAPLVFASSKEHLLDVDCVQPVQTLPVVSSPAHHAIRNILGPGKADDIITKGYEITLRRQDFWTLNNCRWLNDQVS